jgi:phage terminase large subunit
MRIEAVRRIFPKCWFNEATRRKRAAMRWATTTNARTRQRNVGLGPEHDWSSHAADGFGLMAINYEEPSRLSKAGFGRTMNYPKLGVA